MIQVTRLAFLAMVICFGCAAIQGAQIAFDSAGDSAYNNGWTQGSNGGFGWGSGWNLSMFPGHQAIIGDSTTNGSGATDSDGDINSPRVVGGRAWGLVGAVATRTFSSLLQPGQEFSIDYDDYGGQNLNYNSSVYLIDPSGATAVSVRANIGSDYVIETGIGLGSQLHTGVPDTDEGVHLDFTMVSSGVQVALTPYTAGATTTTFIAPYTGPVSGFGLNSLNTFVIDPVTYTPYFNNISVTPEPAGLVMLALTVPALMARRRRR